MKKFFNDKVLWVFLFVCLLFAFLIFSFMPIVNPTEKDCIMVTGIVDKSRFVEENKDLQFKLKGCDDVYYLNHLYEKDFGVISKFDSLTGEKITVYYVDHWTLLNPLGKYKHVARVVVGDSSNVIYTEF